MTQTEVFIEHYKRLERAVRRTYGISDHDSIFFYHTKTSSKSLSQKYSIAKK